jgi:hypothetical protein
MFIVKEKIEEIISIFNKREKGWYSLKPKLEQVLGSKTYQELIDEFESGLSSLPKGKWPHYSLVFYLALVILTAEEVDRKEVARYVKEKESYCLMRTGLRIFLSSKSSNFKYEAQLSAGRYKNKYEYVSFFSGFVPDYQFEMTGYLLLLKLIYEVNRSHFWQLLMQDKQNVMFLCLMTGAELSFSYEELIPLLTSNDELKANGTLFYLMSRFSYYVLKYERKSTEGNKEILVEEIQKIANIFERLPVERKIFLMVNYMFVENYYPEFFDEELQQTNVELVVYHLELQELNNLYKLVKLHQFIKILECIEVEKLFIKYFLHWLQNDGNPHIWNSVKEEVREIIQLLSLDTRNELLDQITSIKEQLWLSSFDRQVRYGQYLQEEGKAKIIDDIVPFCSTSGS